MFRLLHPLVDAIQPILVPICFVAAWAIVLMVVANVVAAVRSSTQRARTMHQIPCTGCAYFTNDHRLKCPVRPHEAQSEAAIGCQDYCSSRSAILDRFT